jgi:hypothetical protein
MLTAILHGKAGRVELEKEQLRWREVFQRNEDLLTSVFFGRLGYLSDDLQHQVVSLLIGAPLASELGTLQGLSFWPQLKGLEGRRYVEPDVLLSFEQHLLVVEVKPPFGGKQDAEQWRAEIKALLRENEEDKAIVFLALGRNVPDWRLQADDVESHFADDGVQVLCREWRELMHGLHRLMDLADLQDRRVLADWQDAFKLFGLRETVAPYAPLLKLTADRPMLAADIDLVSHWEPRPERQFSSRKINWQSLLPVAAGLEEGVLKWIFPESKR